MAPRVVLCRAREPEIQRTVTGRIPSELSVGFEEIDAQHRGLFEAMDAARRAADTGDLAATRSAVCALGDVLMAHFAAEEGFMAQSLYPDRARHKAAHDLFMQDFAQLNRELETGLTELAAQWIATRVPEWVKFHIRVNDSALGEFLSSKRFRPSARGASLAKPQAS
jgi:hemerythrin